MTDDIVARLREAHERGREWKRANIELAEQLITATAERDALRANLRDELERADAWHKTFLETQKHNDELRAENEKLRDAVNGKLFDKALKAFDENDRLTAERDALRAILRWRIRWTDEEIDAALNKGGTDDAGQ